MFPSPIELASFLEVLRAHGVIRWRFADGAEVELGAPQQAQVSWPAPSEGGFPVTEGPSAIELAAQAASVSRGQ